LSGRPGFSARCVRSPDHPHHRRIDDDHHGGAHDHVQARSTTTSTAKPAATTITTPPTTTTAPASSGVSFANCTEAKAAGYSDILRGAPGYASKHDRDNDGIACES